MITVRDMTDEDLEVLGPLMKANHTESYYNDIEYDPIAFKFTFKQYIYDPDRYSAIALEKGKLIGYLLGFKEHYLFNRSLYYASDLLLYVDKKYRGKLVGKKLLKDFESWAKAHKCKEVLLGTKTDITTERTKLLYEKLGYKTVGYIFSKKVD